MKFGSREICNVVFKTTAANQKIGDKVFEKAGMPAFFIDTAKTSSMEQQTSTVYATGGPGNNRLIAWEGEKTMTFNVEDALISPMGLAVLSGAGLYNAKEDRLSHVHMVIDAAVKKEVSGDLYAEVDLETLQDETGLHGETKFDVCNSVPAYATVLDGSGAGIVFVPEVAMSGDAGSYVDEDTIIVEDKKNCRFTLTKVDGLEEGSTVKLDFYLVMAEGVTEIEIGPNDFGGFYYIEAQTLYRREDTGEDMAAEIIFPRVKVQSGFTLSMAASGDPSTFSFVMDAFPAYTMFNKTKKTCCNIQIIGVDKAGGAGEGTHSHKKN